MSLPRLWGVWGGEAGRPRRRSGSSAPTCESLEGRQLLSAAGLRHGGIGTSFTQRAYPAQFALGGAQGGFQTVNGGSMNGGQGPGSLRRLHGAVGALGGAGGGALGMRNQLRLTRLQSLAGGGAVTAAAPSQAAPGGTTQALTVTPPAPADLPDLAAAAPTGQAVAATPAGADTAPGANTPAAPGGTVWYSTSGPMDGWNRPDVMIKGTATPSDATVKAFDNLHTDMQAIQDKSEVTPKLLAAVRNDVKAIEDAATSDPSEDSLKTFTTDLQGLDGKLPTDAQRDQLVADFTAVLKSRGITDQSLIDKTVADVQAVVQATHITADDLATIEADRKAIADANGADDTAADPAAGDAKATTVKFGPAGAPTDMLLAGLSGGNLSGMPIGGPFTFATTGVPFGGPMGGPQFTVARKDLPLGGPMSGGTFNVMSKALPFGGAMGTRAFTMSTAGGPTGAGPVQTFAYGGPMNVGAYGGRWGY